MVGVWCCPAAWVRRVAVGGGIATLLWTGLVLAQFDVHTAGWQMGEQVPWLGMLGLNYGLAVDGVSLPLLGLSSLVLLLVLSSEPPVVRPRLYYSLLLLAGAAVAGAFLAQNVLLFFLFYELELLPLYLLIGIWGGVRRDYAAVNYSQLKQGAFSSPAVSKPTASLWGGLQHPQSTVTSALNNRFWCPQYNYNLRQLKLLKELSSPH
jgi:NADH:ubiquinone oxidoreductase subunit 4 (chain M)